MKKLLQVLALTALICVPWVTQAQTALPVTMDFENESEFNTWTHINSNTNQGNIDNSGRKGGDVAHDGSFGFSFYIMNEETDDHRVQYLVSPELTGTGNGVHVTFDFGYDFFTGFSVGYSTTTADPTDPSAFTWDKAEGYNIYENDGGETLWESYEYDFPEGTKYIAIRTANEPEIYLYIDNISLTAISASCNAIDAFPITYGFETSEGFATGVSSSSAPTANNMGVCWRNEPTVTTGTYSGRLWCTSTTYKKNGSQSLMLPDKNNGNITMLVFPPMNFSDANGYIIDFWIYRYANGSNDEGFRVYISDEDTIGANAISLGTYSRNYGQAYPQAEASSGWYHYETAPITHAQMSGTVYLIFEGISHNGNATYVDDVKIKVVPSCLAVSVGDVTLNSATSATFSWTDDGNSGTPTYTVKMGETELSGSTIPAVSIEGTTATLTNLTADHQYNAGDFTVIANCGVSDHSEAANVPAFHTGYCLPAGSNIDNKGITGVAFGSGDGTTVSKINANGLTTTSPYYGNFSSMIGAVAAGTTANVDITLGTGYTYVTIIWIDWNNNLTFEDGEIVYAGESSSTNPTTFTASFDIDANQALGDYRMRIASADSYYDSHKNMATAAGADPCPTSGYIQIHDYTLRVTEAPSCWPVTNLTAPEANITSSSITLTWTDNNSGSATYIITDGEDAEIPAAQLENLTTTGVTINGLTANTAYSFKVKADCGGGEYSDPVGINNVKTDCGAEAIPFTENFDSYTASSYTTAVVPDCWIFSPEPSGYYYTSIYNEYPYSGTLNLRFYSYYKTVNVAVLPEMAAATNTLQVRFYHRPYSTSYGTMQVGYVTDIEDTTTFVNLKTLARTSTTYAPEEITFEEAPTGSRIAFRYIGSTYSSNYKWYIDDITVEAIPTCKTVTGVTAATNVTSNSATLSWTDERNEGATYTIYNKATEPATLLGTTEAGVTTINLTGLTASTTYNQLVIVANCGSEEHSGEVSVPSFTTQSNACAITGVTISAPTGVTRGDVVVNDENHSVTIPVYYLSSEEMNNLAGTLYKSSNSHIYRYNTTSEDYDIEVYSLASLKEYLAMNTPYTVRVKAQDPSVYQDWTITLQGEECSTPRNLTFTNVERRAFTANWTNADPEAVNYQVVLSGDELDEEGLAAEEKIAVNGTKTYTFTNLDRETPYHVYVRTNCGNDTYSSWLSGTVTTKGLTFCEDVPVADDLTTNSYIPLRPYYLDSYNQHTQLIYSDADMTGLEGKQLSSMTFYSNFSHNFTLTPAVVKLGATMLNNLTDGYASTDGMTTVSSAMINVADNKWVITFDAPYAYAGGNLLVDITTTNNNQCSSSSDIFYGKNASGNVTRYMSNSSNTEGSVSAYQPKVSFHYCEVNEACPTVANVEVSDITETSATVTWDAATGDYLSGYQVIKSESELNAAALDAYAGDYAYEGTALTCDLTGLNAYTEYYIYVRANCGAPDNTNSTWQSTTFRTLSACGVVSNLAVEITGKHTATATWEKTKPAQDNNFAYILSTTDGLDDATLNGMPKTGSAISTLSVDLDELTSNTTYYLHVQNNCGGDGMSPWVSTSFTTPDAMPAVVNLTTTQITHTAIAATWQKNVAQFADETQWQVAAVEHGETPAAWTIVNDTRYTFVGLTPETSYDLYVRPYQTSPVAFGTAAHLDEVMTEALPPTCETVANATTNTGNAPLYGNYAERAQRIQSIYPASMLENLQGKTINSLQYFVKSGSSSGSNGDWGTGTWNISIAITEQNDLSAGFDNDAVMTQVYSGSLTANTTNGMTITLDNNFQYNGGNLLIQFVQPTGSGYSDCQFYALSDQTGASRYAYPSTAANVMTDAGTLINYLPKVQFCYEAGACRDVTNLTVSNVTTDSAIVSWMPGNTEVEWVYNLLDANLPEPTANDYYPTMTPYIINDGLQSDHDYRFWVRPVIDDEPCGNWKSIAFSTAATCGLPTVLPADGITATTATLHAAHETIGTAEEYSFQYWIDGDEENKQLAPSSVTGSVEITGLTPNTTYWYNVMVTCTGEDGGSRWSEPMSFLTECDANTEFPWSENFENYATGNFSDNCWVNERIIDGTGSGTLNVFQVAINTLDDNSTKKIQLPDMPNGTVTKLRLPEMTFTADQYQFILEVYRNNYSSAKTNEGVRVYLSTDGEIEGATELAFIPRVYNVSNNIIPAETASGWYTYKLPISVTGNYYIVLAGESKYGSATNMDNFVVRETPKYTVNTSVSMTVEETPAPMGSIASTPATLTNVYDNTAITLSATPESGYHFVNWTEGDDVVSTVNTYQFKLEGYRNLRANFDTNTYTLTVVSANETMGSVSDDVIGAKHFKTYQISAEANYGYHFAGWADLEPTDQDYLANPRTVTVTGPATYTANFDYDQYTVTTLSDNSTMGSATVVGDATKNYLEDVTIKATPNYGYHFVSWKEADTVYSSTADTVVKLLSDRTLTAVFDSNQYTITAAKDLLPNSTEYGGEVAGTATVKFNLPVTLTATPEYGYHLVNWVNDHDEVCGTDEILTVNAYRDSTFTAHFDTNVYNVTVHFDANMGTVEGPATIKHFLNADYVATANTGYRFVNWTDSNSIVLGTSTTLNIAAVSNTIVNANFDTNTYALTVNVAAACEGWGTVDGSNPAAKHFVNYEISATPAAGYHFVQWNDGNTDNPRTVTLTEAKTYTATFDTTHAELAWSADAFTGYSLIDFNNWKPTLTNPHGVEVRYGYEKAPGTTQNLFIDAQTGVIGVDMVPGHIQAQPGVYTVYAVHETSQEYFYDSVAYTLTIEYGVVTSLKKNIDDGGVVSFSDYTTEATLTHFYADEHVMAYIANGNEVAVKAEPATGFHFINWEAGDNVNGYTAFATTEEATYTVPNAAGINLRANFDTITYTLTVVSANETMGSVDGSVAAAKHFKTYQISAEANYGYHFAGWADLASTDPNYMANPRTVTLTKDSIITATFANNQYTVTGESADTTMGNVSGTATVDYLQNVTLTATAKYGYHFTGWSNGATTESITIPAVKDSTVTANFTYNQYTITVANADPTKGSVSDNATVNYLSNVNLTATPEVGYHFVSWTEDDTVYSTHADTVVKTLSDRTLTAHFAINTYNITVNYESTLGTVTNDDNDNATVDSGYVFENVEHGTKLHFTATVEEGSRFANWSDGNVNVLTNSIEYTVTSTRDLWANFNDAGTYQVTLNYDPQKGIVSGGGAHHADDPVTITATPNDGFRFVRWEDINGTVTTGNSYNFTMPMYDTAFTAVFDTNVYEIAAIAALDNRAEIGTGLPMGTVTLVGRHMHFLNDVLEATAAHGYTFSGWYSNGTLVSEANPYIFSPESDSVFEARFTVNNYTVSTVSANTVMGSVAATAPVEYLGTVEISATAEYGYHFVHWTEADTVYSRTADTVVLATDNRVLTAVFDFSQYTFVATCDTNMGIVTPDTTTDNYLTVITTTAEAKEGYRFIGWADQVENPVRSDTLKANTVITALFDTNVYNVTVNANPVEGSVEGPATIKHFLSGTYTATATPCYHFVSWTDTTNNVLSTEATYTVEQPTAHVVLNANFELTVYTGDTNATACYSYTWNGLEITESGDTSYMYTTVNGCDSLVTLHMTINGTTYGDTSATACYSYTWNGLEITESGDTTFLYTGINEFGCDSLVTLHMTINGTTYGDTSATACYSYTWNGLEITESGDTTFLYTGINEFGCDSLVTLHMTINGTTYGDTSATACYSYTWNGLEITESGDTTFLYTGINEFGCDSLVTLHMTINGTTYGDTSATACYSYTWNGLEITESGDTTFLYTGINEFGCDSLVTLHMTINGTTYGDTSATACYSYTWNGLEITESGDTTFLYTGINEFGCDSLVTLHMTINGTTYGDTSATACYSYTWNGLEITESGDTTFLYTGINEFGCDSLVTLHMTINGTTYGDTSATACYSYTWNGLEITESGDTTFLYTGINEFGCDSLVTLHMTINGTTYGDTSATACYSYTWNGLEITESGDTTFLYTGINEFGCDSLVTLHMTINGTTYGDTSATACYSYTWNGLEITESGDTTFLYTGINEFGCDSLVTLHMTINGTTYGDTSATACYSYTWNGLEITESGDTTFLYTGINEFGCDSLVTLHMTINGTTYGDTSATACYSYTWNGLEITESGDTTFLYTGINEFGCDSLVTLHMTINGTTYGDTSATACYSYTWNGLEITESGDTTFLYTGINEFGCDSLVTLHMTINVPTDTTIEDTILQNELPYTFNGIVFNGEQSVDIQLTNVAGCDSIIHYTLHVQWNSSNMVDSTICASQLPFVWNGVTFTEAGTQAATLPAADQTDSVVVMTLNLFPQTSGDTTAEACESFVWNGQPYTLSDDYQYNYTDINGCDSVVTLHLTINVPTDTTIEDTILQNELPYTFNGIVFNGDRQVDIQLTNAAGCDSIIHYTLHVQWNSSNMVDSTVCASQLPFVWNGVTFNEAGTQAATLPAADQTDSVVVMTLNLFPQTSGDTTAMACESFVWNGMPFTLSDDYQYNYTDINGCDSVVTLHLTINHSVYDTIEMSVLDSVEWHGEWYYTTGQYNDTLTAATGCDSIVTLDLTVTYRVYHNVTLVSGDTTMGSVTPMGVTVVEHDSLFTATATALPGRHFVAWMHDNDTASTEAEYTFAVTEDITLTATFDYDAVTVILGVNDPLMGSVNPEPGTYTLQVGEHVHATATAMEGYHFTGWTILGIDETATSEVVDFVVPAEAAGLTIRVMANFAQNTGIDDVETADFSVYSNGNKIVVSGAEDKDVYVYDVNGRCLRKQTKAGETVEFTMNASGAYLVKVGNAPAKRVVVVR